MREGLTKVHIPIRQTEALLRLVLGLGLLFSLGVAAPAGLAAQTTAAPAAARQLGTVKSISGNTVTIATDAGQTVVIAIPDTAKVLQLPVGSTDLKTAKPSQISDITVGDRLLASGTAGETAGTLTARTVVLMKSADIAQMQASQQAEWRTNGVGGIVSSVDPGTGTITLTSGTKKITVNTTPKTVFRRFSGDSVKYQDAKPGTLSQIHPKDQLQARGVKSADGTSIQAEEVVSGAFEDLSGIISNADASAGTITLKDLATKKAMTVNVTANTNIRQLPPEMAARFAARTNGGGGQGGGGRRSGGAGTGEAAGGDAAGMRRAAGADLSQMINRLPSITAADLHKGDAVMIVASEPTPGATTVTAITVLTGVDPILTANPNGGMDLSMNMGGGEPTE